MTFVLIDDNNGNRKEFETMAEAKEKKNDMVSLGADPGDFEITHGDNFESAEMPVEYRRAHYIRCSKCKNRFDPHRNQYNCWDGFRCSCCGKKNTIDDLKYRRRNIPTTKNKRVYLIKNTLNGYVKIGISNNPSERIRGIETTSGCRLRVLKIQSNDKNAEELEKELHDKYSNSREIGEWFDISNERVNNIKNEL